jgi:hypothetical protein
MLSVSACSTPSDHGDYSLDAHNIGPAGTIGVPSGPLNTDMLTHQGIDSDSLQDAERVDLGCCVTEIAVRETALLGLNSVAHAYNNFVMTLNTDRFTYSTTDLITIWGTLEYVGDDDSIEIWSSCPFMIFSIAGGDEFDFGNALGGSRVDVLVTSVIEKGKVYHFEYQKSGGWSASDPNAGFWEAFFKERDLFLPTGEYTITLIGAFSLTDRVVDSKSGLTAELRITVTQ